MAEIISVFPISFRIRTVTSVIVSVVSVGGHAIVANTGAVITFVAVGTIAGITVVYAIVPKTWTTINYVNTLAVERIDKLSINT